MLFNSFEFLCLFLPVTVLGYIALRRVSSSASIWWLLAASLVFYGAWKIDFLPIMCGSILGNYALSRQLARQRAFRKFWLIIGICGNLGTLFYFKYTNFFIDNVNAVFGTGLTWPAVILPIGISFFTFQQIAFLVDAYRGETVERSFSRYAVFISFFPQLIAGPIVHHREMMPQVGRKRDDAWGDIAAGLTLLTIGLIKKMVVADGVAIPSSAMFDAAARGAEVAFFDAWIGSVAYSLQIYFDFSAYSDMAIGLGRMMGIDFPINFASPYKATSITDFWRRWHITLSRFLRDYLYIPLGGGRAGASRQKVNLLLTMLLGGIWHGAGWTFVLWGLLHGLYLLINHSWRATRLSRLVAVVPGWGLAARGLTLLAVVVAWVPFRAADLATTLEIWRGMAGLNGIGAVKGLALAQDGKVALFTIAVAAAIALLAPNAYQLLATLRLGRASPGYPATVIAPRADMPRWMWSRYHAAAVGTALVVVVLKFNDISEFIYFQF